MTTVPPGAVLVDARGMRFPWPALRLARAVRAGAARILLLADDDNAEREIRALVLAHGWALSGGDGRFDLLINVSATPPLPDGV